MKKTHQIILLIYLLVKYEQIMFESIFLSNILLDILILYKLNHKFLEVFSLNFYQKCKKKFNFGKSSVNPRILNFLLDV